MATDRLYISDITKKHVSRLFPNLIEHDTFEYTSNVDYNYNCLSWAIGANTYLSENEVWAIWPWPTIPDDTAVGWSQFLIKHGFAHCPDSGFIPGFEKAAIYGSGENDLHVCRSDRSGIWKSKLGVQGPDIDHFTLECLYPVYGEVSHLLQRQRQDWWERDGK